MSKSKDDWPHYVANKPMPQRNICWKPLYGLVEYFNNEYPLNGPANNLENTSFYEVQVSTNIGKSRIQEFHNEMCKHMEYLSCGRTFMYIPLQETCGAIVFTYTKRTSIALHVCVQEAMRSSYAPKITKIYVRSIRKDEPDIIWTKNYKNEKLLYTQSFKGKDISAKSNPYFKELPTE